MSSRRAASIGSIASWVAAALLLGACLGVQDFFFAGRPAEPYSFDESDPALDGDLSDPHPSVVPASLREEGFEPSTDGALLHWVFARHPREESPVTIVFQHGNGPGLGRFWDRVEVLWQLGYQVLLYDYPGYGRSEGRASEAGMYAAAHAMLRMVASRDDVDPGAIVLYGHSLGGAPTFDVAVRAMRSEVRATRAEGELVVRPRAVVTESAWCSIAEMVRDGSFLDLPGELISRLRFDNCARIAELREVPVMLLHGRADRVVPPRQLALLEGRAAITPVVHLVEGASHVDVSVHGEPLASLPPIDGVPRPSAQYAEWLAAIATP